MELDKIRKQLPNIIPSDRPVFFPRFLHTIPGRRFPQILPLRLFFFSPKRFFLSVPGSFRIFSFFCQRLHAFCRSLFFLQFLPVFFRHRILHQIATARCHTFRTLPMHPQNLRQHLFRLFSWQNPIHKPMLHQKLRPLEPFRQFLSYCLLNNPRSRKPDQRMRLRQNNIPQHRPARRHAARRRVRQHTHIQKPRITVSFQRRRRLRHLHQRNNPLLHPRPSRARKQNHRQRELRRPLHRPRNLLPNSLTHTGHHKPAITDPDHRLHPVDPSLTSHNSLRKSCSLLQSPHLLFIPRKPQRIPRRHPLIPFLKTPIIQKKLNPPIRMHPKIIPTLRTNIKIPLHILRKNSPLTSITLLQNPLRRLRHHPIRRVLLPKHRLLKILTQHHTTITPYVITLSLYCHHNTLPTTYLTHQGIHSLFTAHSCHPSRTAPRCR